MKPQTERGMALMTVLLFMTMIVVLTIAVMNIAQADVATGVREQQAVQVFNIAEAGMHFAIARLQQANADTYTGEAVTISDGSTIIGTATVAVRCLDGTLPSVNSCSPGSTYAAYRRIISTGSLAVAGPTRVLTAIVLGTTSSTAHFAACGYYGVNLAQGVQIYGDIGTNSNMDLARGGNPTKICNSTPGGACTGPSSPPSTPYTGSAYAVGYIHCGGGTCNSSQIEGTIAPNQPAGSVCPPVTLPAPAPASGTTFVARGTTMTIDLSANNTNCPASLSTYNYSACSANYGVVHLDDNSGATVATLNINTGTDPTRTVGVLMRGLWMGRASHLRISGAGKVVLWLLEPTTQDLKAEQQAVIGECGDSASCGSNPVGTPVTGDRLTINALSTAQLSATTGCLNSGDSPCPAIKINQSGLLSATFIAPNGYAGLEMNQSGVVAGSGAMLAGQIQFDQNSIYVWDPNSRFGAGAASNFNMVKYWKDQ